MRPVILTGWKEISKHLRYGVRTLQRWRDAGLPVKRIRDTPRSPVVADSEELEAWILRRTRVPPGAPQSLLDNLRRAQELREEIAQNRKELKQRIQALREELAELRAKRRK